MSHNYASYNTEGQDPLDLLTKYPELLEVGKIANAEYQDRSASRAVPTVPTILNLPTKISDDPEMLAPDGTFTLPFTGVFNIVLLLNINSTGTGRVLYLGSDYLSEGSWLPNTYGTRKYVIADNTSTQVAFLTTISANRGQKFRLLHWCSANVTLTTDTPIADRIIPAVRVMLVGTRSVPWAQPLTLP